MIPYKATMFALSLALQVAKRGFLDTEAWNNPNDFESFYEGLPTRLELCKALGLIGSAPPTHDA